MPSRALAAAASRLSYRSADTAEIKILGFQSGEGLRFDENVKHSYFIYPDENVRIEV